MQEAGCSLLVVPITLYHAFSLTALLHHQYTGMLLIVDVTCATASCMKHRLSSTSGHQRVGQLGRLAVVFEALLNFYRALHHGTPVVDARAGAAGTAGRPARSAPTGRSICTTADVANQRLHGREVRTSPENLQHVASSDASGIYSYTLQRIEGVARLVHSTRCLSQSRMPCHTCVLAVTSPY
jgi:hypothetical protein